MANDYVRVKDKQTRHEFSIRESRVNDGVEVLDKPALSHSGDPLPPKYHVAKGSPPAASAKVGSRRTATSSTPGNTSGEDGRPAETVEEN